MFSGLNSSLFNLQQFYSPNTGADMGKLNLVEILDVSARDGLQNESRLFSTKEKVDLINQVIAAGVRRLEVASFVHPKRVPQMADAEAVIEALPDRKDVTYIGLVLNERGLERALETKVDEVGCVALPSDTFAQKNQGQTYRQSVEVAGRILTRANAANRRANVTISAAFGCPFEGEVEIDRVVDMAIQLAQHNPHEIALADTIGVGDPWHVAELVAAIRKALPDMPLRAHFHNTRNTGLANGFAAVQGGISTLDVSVGGIGGCPFAPAATGNVPAEDMIYMLQRHGFASEISLPDIVACADWLTEKFDRVLPGMLGRAGLFPPQNSQSNTRQLEAEAT